MTKIYKSDKNKVSKSDKQVYKKGERPVYKKTTKVPKQEKYNSNQFPKV